MINARTADPEATRALGAALAGLVRPGDLLLLAGELGAGKTAFTQGLGRGLGVTDRITSPTFTIAAEYAGRLTLHHLDVYRLDQLAEAVDLGLAEILDDEAVVVIEWGDAIAPVLPPDFLEIRLTFGDGDDDRLLAIRPVGRRWAARSDAVAGALSPWVTPASGNPAC